MKVRLAYGAGGLDVELPDERTTVVEPAYHAGAEDERAVLREALRAPVAGPPLRALARPGQKRRDLDLRRHPRAAARPGHLSDDELRAVHLEQTRDIARTVAGEGRGASVCVLPEGPQTIAYVDA